MKSVMSGIFAFWKMLYIKSSSSSKAACMINKSYKDLEKEANPPNYQP